MEFRIADTFTDSLSRLTAQEQKAVKTTAFDLQMNPANPGMQFHKLDRVVRTPSSEQVRRPLNRDGMEVWRPYSQWLGPLREALGPLADA